MDCTFFVFHFHDPIQFRRLTDSLCDFQLLMINFLTAVFIFNIIMMIIMKACMMGSMEIRLGAASLTLMITFC